MRKQDNSRGSEVGVGVETGVLGVSDGSIVLVGVAVWVGVLIVAFAVTVAEESDVAVGVFVRSGVAVAVESGVADGGSCIGFCVGRFAKIALHTYQNGFYLKDMAGECGAWLSNLNPFGVSKARSSRRMPPQSGKYSPGSIVMTILACMSAGGRNLDKNGSS